MNTADGKTLPGLIPGDPKEAGVLGSAVPAGGLLSVEGFQMGEANSLTETECRGEYFSIKYSMKANVKKEIFLPCSTLLMARAGLGVLRVGAFFGGSKKTA